MSQMLEASCLHRWLDRLSPAEERHLLRVIRTDDALPNVEPDPFGPLDEDPPAALLALVGAIDDPSVPGDYASNSDTYFQERTSRRHAAGS